MRFQALPNPFDLWVDGLEVPVFEEFGAGTEALHLERPEERAALLRDPDYRRRFREQWGDRLRGRAYHRDFARAHVVACPDAWRWSGSRLPEIAAERGRDAVDTFLDLAAQHGDAHCAGTRWSRTTARTSSSGS
jgi:N-acyl-D-aspartate/D-glutamate deacylase